MRRLIDVHTHLGWFSDARLSADGAQLCDLLRKGGITEAISFSAEGCYGSIRSGNQYTFQEVMKHPMLRMLVIAHPYHYKDTTEILESVADHPKVVGIKIHPHLGNFHILDRNLSRLVEQEIAPRGLPILSHVANDAPNVRAADFFTLAKRFPETNFIAAHLGIGILGDSQAALNAWCEMQPKNVWLDMATIRAVQTSKVEEYISVVGADRICFGTDAPLYFPPAFTAALNSFELTEAAREQIAWRNALKAFPRLAAVQTHVAPLEEPVRI
jgi:predicted TIM-barrel fold metal-dependent hydrolase